MRGATSRRGAVEAGLYDSTRSGGWGSAGVRGRKARFEGVARRYWCIRYERTASRNFTLGVTTRQRRNTALDAARAVMNNHTRRARPPKGVTNPDVATRRNKRQRNRDGRRDPRGEQASRAVSRPVAIRGGSRINNQRQGSRTPMNHRTATECETALRTHHSESRLVRRQSRYPCTARETRIEPLQRPSTGSVPNPTSSEPLTHFSDRNRTTTTECENYHSATDITASVMAHPVSRTDGRTNDSLASSRVAPVDSRRPATSPAHAPERTTHVTRSATTAASSVLPGLSADCDFCSGGERSFRRRSSPLNSSLRV